MAKRKSVYNSKGRKKKKVDEEDEWFASITSQDDIDDTLVSKIYHINDECQKKRHNIPCKENPNCFEMLGQSELAAKTRALPTTLGPNPNDDMRKENFPVGLKNLGATCYMNSLVQSLFMNTIFRQGIYNWKGTEAEDKLLHQLKLLFANLQYSASRYHDPVSFLQSTEMSSALQQDAQEFFKMIVTYICENAKSDVKNLVEDQFMGQIAYNTECKKCHNKSVRESDFFELELNVKGFKTIEDSLKNYVIEEELTGQNQYFCSNCNSLQDGGRYISIRKLPLVLSVQLLRFVYDMQTLTKKKVRDAISFPMTIDLRSFVEPKPPKRTSSNTTNNKANNNTTNNTTNNATNNNTNNTSHTPDTNITPIIDITADDVKMELSEPTSNVANENSSESPANPQPSPTATSDNEPQVRVTRSQTKQVNPPPPTPATSTPSSSTSADNDEYIYELTSVMMHRGMTAYGGHYVVHVKDECTGKWWQFNDEDVRPIEEAKVGVIDDRAYETPTTTSASSEATAIDVDAITSDTSATPPSPSKKKGRPKAKTTKKGKGKGKQAKDTQKEDEENGEGDKTNDSQDKGRISSTMAYMLTYARRTRPILATSAPDKSLVELISKETEKLKITAQDYNNILHTETDRLTARKAQFETIQSDLSPAENAPFNWISTEWLSSWIKAVPDLTQINNTDLMCEHNKVNPLKVGEMKRISRAVWEVLNAGEYAGGPTLTENDYCVDCIFRICKDEKESTTSTKEKRVLLQELAESDEKEGFLISKNWFKEFSKNNPEELSNDMTSELMCPHNGLTISTKLHKFVPKKVWDQLRVFHIEGPVFPSNTAPCEECAQQDHETREQDDKRKKERQNELKALRELHTKVKTRSSEPLTTEPQYLISYPWCLKWKLWVDDPEMDDPPGRIDNSILLCPHEKLLYDPVALAEELLPSDTAKMSIKPQSTEATTNGNGAAANGNSNSTSHHVNGDKMDLTPDASSANLPTPSVNLSAPSVNPPAPVEQREPPPFLIIKAKTWEQVSAKYPGGPEIACSSKSCTLEVCVECLTSRRLQEEEDRINYPAGSLYVQQAPHGDGKDAPSMPKRSGTRYRLRDKNPKKKIHPINSLTDTVQSLKLRIYQILEVPPFQQAIWFNDVLLDDESSPLCSYRIPNGSDLTLVVVEGDPEILEENANKGQAEEGFKGSIFYSKSSKEVELPPSGQQETKDNSEKMQEDGKEEKKEEVKTEKKGDETSNEANENNATTPTSTNGTHNAAKDEHETQTNITENNDKQKETENEQEKQAEREEKEEKKGALQRNGRRARDHDMPMLDCCVEIISIPKNAPEQKR